MTLAFRHRPVPDSPLSRWDARWKLAAVLVAVCGIASLEHIAPSACALLLAFVLILGSRLPLAWVRGRLLLFAIASLPFLLVLPFTLSGDGWDIGRVHVAEAGLQTGGAVFCRGLAIGCFSLILLGTAPIHHTLAAAHKLWLPGLLVQLTLLAYRYAFLLADETRRLRVALRTRGFRMRGTRHGYRTLAHATGALLVRSADRAETVSAAMRTRGFNGTFHTLHAFHTRFADIISCVLLAAAIVALVLWDRLVLS